MQIVIDIPEDDLNFIKDMFADGEMPDERSLTETTMYAIANGTAFSKGHGRLLILDEKLVRKYFTSFGFSCQEWISEVGISNATLKVIEADREAEDD